MANNIELKDIIEEKLAYLTQVIDADVKTFFTDDEGVAHRQPLNINDYPATGAWERGFDDGQLRGKAEMLKELLNIIANN